MAHCLKLTPPWPKGRFLVGRLYSGTSIKLGNMGVKACVAPEFLLLSGASSILSGK